MTFGWNGGTPVQFNEPGTNLELALRYTANNDIIISGVRVWHGSATVATSGRKGRLWTVGGTLITDVAMAESLPTISDYTTYSFASPVNISAGTVFYVSYDTIQYYGAVASAGFPVISSDGSVTADAGRFGNTRGTFPNTASNAYFGIDIVYTEDTSGNQAPDITGVTVQRSDLSVVTVATVTDETPSTVLLNWNWGDGTNTNTGAGVVTSSHTYTETGLYAILVTATDDAGATDTFATAVQITVSAVTTDNEDWIQDILDAVVSDVQRSGYFDRVNTHEPKSAPGSRMTAAVWYQSMDPIPLISGLASTSARIVFVLRLYQNWISEPQDMIDPLMHKAAANLMRRYHDDFDFGGIIRNIDLLGAFGVALSAQSGFLDINGVMHRVIDITIPCLVNDVWPQVS